MQKLIPLCLLEHTTTVYVLQLLVKHACFVRSENKINDNLPPWTIQVLRGQNAQNVCQRLLNYNIVAVNKKTCKFNIMAFLVYHPNKKYLIGSFVVLMKIFSFKTGQISIGWILQTCLLSYVCVNIFNVSHMSASQVSRF